ncbi:Sister chromatid cohesion protein DCC1 [Pseudolycoriella hygida]|uniref:Sister chromatid cohesion protein DCC1 n=1 Tax=Pseudolycoriella hygida TaxID=35572 RepID=A0A9Q0N0L1_9DIPT|nr:Sister chromatid cohesion protein DCC1 [Pseudolycoriella hygida]
MEQKSEGITDSPKKGPTLSTSTSSSFEPLDPHDPSLSRLATKMFQKTHSYVTHELNTSLEDYKLLENMQKLTISKYSDMNQIAENLVTSSAELKQKFDELLPYLAEIDEIEKTVNDLEVAAFKLDAYSLRLESKFNELLKKKYERTAEDVGTMLTYAKLEANKLTPITQTLYYPEGDVNMSDYKLLELNDDVFNQIRKGQVLSFKGGLSEKIVLCTENKTYDVKEAEISNSLLLIPNLKSAQQTSTSPLKSPKNNMSNRSLDSSIEDDDTEQTTTRVLERRPVLKIFHEYFECREIHPRFRKMNDLLQMTRYSGPENEYCIDKSLLFTFQQLLNTIQCSRAEFANGLQEYRVLDVDGRMRVLDYEYEYRILSLMLALISENSWRLDEVDRDETINALNGIAPDCIIEGLFDLYTTKVSEQPAKYQYQEDMVCRIIAQYILQQGSKFHVGDFMSSWQEALPEGMTTDEKYLRGIGIIDKDSNPPCVRALCETNLSTKIMDRLKVLFKTKTRWTLEEIEPYIEYFSTPQLSTSSLMSKYARAITDNGVRLYVTKHG